MNINNLMAQGLAATIAQATQTALPGEPGQEGVEFEEMLRQQSQVTKTQRQEERPKEKDKAAGKQEAKKPQEDSTKDQEIAENGQKVAAALVTSQPVVPFEIVAVPEEAAGIEVEVPVMAPKPVEAATWADSTPAQPEQVQPELAGEVLPQEQQTAQPVVVRPEVQAQPVAEQPQAQAQAQEATPELPEAQVQPEAAETAPVVADHRARLSTEERPEEFQVTDAWVQSEPVFQRETATPVKVAENYEAEEPEQLENLDQMRNQLSQAIQNGQSSVQIQLSPANLGQVLVEITRGADGALSIVMTAATEKAAAVLQQHGSGLQQMMAANLETPVQVTVQQSQEPENANQFLNPDGQNRQQHQQQQHEKRQQASTEDFLQQLRLGLVGLENA